MIHFPVLRWGSSYKSLEIDTVVHFATGEPVAEVSQANPGLIARDMRRGARAREVLREVPTVELLGMVKKAAELFSSAELPLGDGSQTADEFVRQQSATTGLPEHMCRMNRMNMEKLRYVLDHLDKILLSLTRGLDPTILSRGYGEEDGVMRSYQATTPVLGMVLPSNSPGVHRPVAADHPAADRVSAQTGSAGAVDPVAHDPSVLRGWGASRGDLGVPGTRAGRGRSPEPLSPQFDLRWRGDRRAVCRQPERAGAWARVQQDPRGRRHRR